MTTPAWIAALILCASPVEVASVETVDLIEANTYFDENGVKLLDQIIFYDWNAKEGRHDIRDWRLLKYPSQYPHPVPGGYESVWREGGRLCKVFAPGMQSTWWQFDTELAQQKILPREDRRELFADKPKRDRGFGPIVRGLVDHGRGLIPPEAPEDE